LITKPARGRRPASCFRFARREAGESVGPGGDNALEEKQAHQRSSPAPRTSGCLELGEVAAFVRKYNPQRGLKAGRLRVAANGDTLARFEDPLFNFDFNFDLIIAPNEIAIFSVTAFNSVFADIELAKIHAS
jgi:hypothetical protein